MPRPLADKPRLLFLSQTLPFPPDGGVKVRTFHILQELARAFDITALCFARRETTALERGVAGLSPLARVEAFPIPQEHDRLRWLGDHARSVLQRRVYTRYVYESADFRRRLTELLQEPWALVHADSLDLAGYFPLITQAPIACTHHDIQSVLLRRRAGFTPPGPRRWYLQHQAALMQAEERRWAPAVALNVVVSELDAATIRRESPTAPIAVVPNGVDTTFFAPAPGRGSAVVFVGGSDWFPNRDGMLWFAREILPLVRRERPELPVRWVGRVTEDVRRLAASLGVETTGHVEDVRPFLREAACVIAPLRVGGGTRIKILDAWAMGKAVISTTVGAEGLNGEAGRELLILDDPAAFAQAIVDLLREPARAEQLGSNSRRRVEREYTWAAIGEGICHAYLDLVRESTHRARSIRSNTGAGENH